MTTKRTVHLQGSLRKPSGVRVGYVDKTSKAVLSLLLPSSSLTLTALPPPGRARKKERERTGTAFIS